MWIAEIIFNLETRTAKIKCVLTGYVIAMVIHYTMKRIVMSYPITGH